MSLDRTCGANIPPCLGHPARCGNGECTRPISVIWKQSLVVASSLASVLSLVEAIVSVSKFSLSWSAFIVARQWNANPVDATATREIATKNDVWDVTVIVCSTLEKMEEWDDFGSRRDSNCHAIEWVHTNNKDATARSSVLTRFCPHYIGRIRSRWRVFQDSGQTLQMKFIPGCTPVKNRPAARRN